MTFIDPSELPPLDHLEQQARAIALTGLDATVRHPAITAEAADVLVRRIAEAPHLENYWRATWDHVGERILTAEWLGRGTRDRVLFIPNEIDPGDVLLHTHPGLVSNELAPSTADVEAASGSLAERGSGFGIINNNLSRFLLVRPPRVPITGTVETRQWHLGRPAWRLTLSRTIHRRPAT